MAITVVVPLAIGTQQAAVFFACTAVGHQIDLSQISSSTNALITVTVVGYEA